MILLIIFLSMLCVSLFIINRQLNAQIKYFHEERDKETAWYEERIQCVLNNKPQPFPPGRTIKEGLEPLRSPKS